MTTSVKIDKHYFFDSTADSTLPNVTERQRVSGTFTEST